MNTIKTKLVEQLTNVEIDLLAAQALGYDAFVRTSQSRNYPHVWVKHKGIFSPTTVAKDMQTLIEFAKIGIVPPMGDEDIYWTAYVKGDIIKRTHDREIVARKRSFELADAVCRCFIELMCGDEVEVDASVK